MLLLVIHYRLWGTNGRSTENSGQRIIQKRNENMQDVIGKSTRRNFGRPNGRTENAALIFLENGREITIVNMPSRRCCKSMILRQNSGTKCTKNRGEHVKFAV